MTAQPNQQPEPPRKSRAKVVQAGRLPVSEFAFDRPGAASPFGDDVTFPVPVEHLTYEHPAEAEWENTEP
jgi:succinate dehydrogenase / fumarate reductase iron-sulfur subunit